VGPLRLADDQQDPAHPEALSARRSRGHAPPVGDITAAFTELGLAPELLAAIGELGYETPTAIQARTIPALLAPDQVLERMQRA